MKIKKITKVNSPGIVAGDCSNEINEYFIYVVFVDNAVEHEEKVKVDMDYKNINFDDIHSISDTMKEKAFNNAYAWYAEYYVDAEEIVGNLEVPQVVETIDGEVDLATTPAEQIRDILGLIPPSKRGKIAYDILKYHKLI